MTDTRPAEGPLSRRHALPAAGAALVLMTLGAGAVETPGFSAAALAALAAGLVLWTASLLMAPPAPAPARRAPRASARPRLPALGVSVLAAAATWWLAADGVYTWQLLVVWTVAVATWLWAWWPAEAPLRLRARGVLPLRRGPVGGALALAGIIVVAAFGRLHRLEGVPAQPTSDHAEKLLDIATIRRGEHPIFFPRNTGREPAQFYVTTWLGELLGRTPDFELLKLGTALVGILAVPAVFLLARELAGARAGLVAALLFSLSHWTIGVTRTGLRHGYGIAAAAFALWLAFRYLRTRDRRDALWLGVALGLGLHGYTAFRAVPLAVALLLVLAAFAGRGSAQRAAVAAGGLACAGAAALVCLPLLRYAVDHRDEVWERTTSRAGADGSAAATLVENLWRALLAFHRHGDDTSVTIERFAPFLDPATGAALLAGVALVVYRLVARREVAAGGVMLCVGVLLLPSALSLAFPDENPSAARLGVVAPLVFAVSGASVDHVLALASALGPGSRARVLRGLTGIALAGGLALAATTNYDRYFRAFDDQYRAFIPDSRAVAEAVRGVIREGVRLDDVYLAGRPHWVDARNVGFELGAPAWAAGHGLGVDDRLPQVEGRPAAFVLHALDPRGAELRARPPAPRIRRVASERPGESFDVYVFGAGQP